MNSNLRFPEVPFINCNGSYLYSIYTSIAGKEEGNDILLGLLSYQLRYTPLDYQTIVDQKGLNPWCYQPVSLLNDKMDLFRIDESFYEFLEQQFHIKIEIKSDKEINNLIEYVKDIMNSKRYLIVNVDEYYVPVSKAYYKKVHNKHSLLIKGYDESSHQFSIIDSERPQGYLLGFQELSDAYYQSKYRRKECIVVNGTEYRKVIDYKVCFYQYLKNAESTECFKRLFCEMEENLMNKNEHIDYYARAYRFTILFKIIPYIKLRAYLYERLDRSDSEWKALKEKANMLVELWEIIVNVLQMNLQKKNYHFTIIKRLADDLITKEIQYNEMVADCKLLKQENV